MVKKTFTKGDFQFSLFTEDNFTFLCMTESNVSKGSTFKFLDNLADTFYTDKPN